MSGGLPQHHDRDVKLNQPAYSATGIKLDRLIGWRELQKSPNFIQFKMKPLYPFNIEVNEISDAKIGLVSVITRTKNRPQFLQRALMSVGNQKYPNWEHIIVNDGGPEEDINQSVLRLKAEQRAKIKIIHLPKSVGMEAASNTGLSIATGEFFVIHDDDDTWHEEFLTHTVEQLSAPNNAFQVAVASNCEIVLEEEVNGVYQDVGRKEWSLWSNQIQLLDLLTRNTIPTISLLVRRKVLTEMKGYVEEMPVLGDWDFNIRLLLLGDIGVVDKKLAYYHQRTTVGTSASNSISGGAYLHQEYWQKYRNSLTRKAVAENSSTIGILNPILTKIDELKQLQEVIARRTVSEIVQREIQQLEVRLDELEKKKQEYFVREFSEIKKSTHSIQYTLHPLQRIKSKISKFLKKLVWTLK